MDELRWILLIFGLALVAAIYLYGRRRDERKKTLFDAAHEVDAGPGAASDPRTGRQPPGAGDEPLHGLADQLAQLNDLLTDAPRGRRRAAAHGGAPAAPEGEPEKIVAIHVAAGRGRGFAGADLLAVFEAQDYVYGEHRIYHSVHEGRTVFSIVNMVKPGWFDPAAMDDFETPGISLFLRLPGPLAATVAFDILVSQAHALAQALDGTLQDETHSTLTQQTLQHLREEVAQFARRTSRGRRESR